MSEDSKGPPVASTAEEEATNTSKMNSTNLNDAKNTTARSSTQKTATSSSSKTPVKKMPNSQNKTSARTSAENPCKTNSNISAVKSKSSQAMTSATVTSGTVAKKTALNKTESSSLQATSSADMQLKMVLREMKELKSRMSKLELEVATLHELLNEQEDLTAEALAILPENLKFENTVDEEKTRWSKRILPQNDYSKKEPVPSAYSNAMRCNNHSWFGDVFLFEVMCQYKGSRPKQNNWFNSIYPYSTFDHFAKQIFSRKKFFRSCVISIGYSDLFNAKAINGPRMKRSLHLLLNHMRAHGADRVKMLSIPPARQMMKNEEYLRLCQTTNRFFKYVTQTHPEVDYINLDSLFINNPSNFFAYFNGDTVSIQISDNLLMRKEDDKFAIFVEPETAKRVIEYVSSYEASSELTANQQLGSGDNAPEYEPAGSYEDSRPNKRRMVDMSYGQEFAKRMATNEEDRFDYLASKPVHSNRRDSPLMTSPGRRMSGPYDFSRHRSPLHETGHNVSSHESIRRRSPPIESPRHRSQGRDPNRYKSPGPDLVHYQSPLRDSRRSFDSAEKANMNISRTIRNDTREPRTSRHDRHEYSRPYTSDRGGEPYYPESPNRDYSVHRPRGRSPPSRRSPVSRRSMSPPPWLKKTQSTMRWPSPERV